MIVHLQNKKRIIALLIALCCGWGTAWAAYSFSATVSGKTLYFNIVSGTNVEVCYPGTLNTSTSCGWDGYTKPTGSLSIPSTVTYNGTTYNVKYIGDYAFAGCTGLTSVTIPSSIICRASDGYTNTGMNGKGLWFKNCSGLTSITLPNSSTFTCLPYQMCSMCTSLSSISIPSRITDIGPDCFVNTALTSVTIPSSVTTIYGGALTYNQNLSSITVQASTPPTLYGYSQFDQNASNLVIYVPCESRDNYRSAWSSYSSKIQGYGCPYTITASARPSSGGTVSGGGGFSYGENCTLTASYPNSGYSFMNWTDSNGNVVSSNRTYSFSVTSSNTYYANYNCQISASANPTAGGSVSGAGYYSYNSSCTLTATPATGYTFTKWTKNGSQVSTNATYTFTVTGAASYVAVFTVNSYVISASASPSAGGTVTGAGTYTHGSSCTLTATPNANYGFVKWTKNGTTVSTDPSYTFSVTEAGSYVAQFAQYSPLTYSYDNTNYTATVTGHQSGSSASGTLAIPSTVSYNGHSYTVTKIGNSAFWNYTGLTGTVTLPSTVTTIEYGAFRGCTGLTGVNLSNVVTIGDGAFSYCSGLTGTLTIPNSVTSVGAQAFYECTHITSISVGSSANLSTTSGTNPFQGCSAVTTVTVNSNNTYFDSRNSCKAIIRKSNNELVFGCRNTVIPSSVTSIGENAFYNQTGLTAITIPNSVTSIGESAFWQCSGLTSITIPGSVASIGASAFYGCTGLTGALVIGEGVTTIGNAAFACDENNTGVTSLTIGGAVTSIGYNAFHGRTGINQINVNATTPPTISNGGAFSGINTSIPVIIPCGTLSAYQNAYGWNSFTNLQDGSLAIAASANPTAGGTVSGAGNYCSGESCTLTATPATGYNFTKWTKNGSQVSTSASYTFTVTAAGTYVAQFTKKTYTISASANPTAGGTITGAGTYEHGASCTLTATPSTGYSFVNWTSGNSQVSTNASYQFTVTGARTLVANFSPNTYTVTLNTNNGTINSGNVTSYTYGVGATLPTDVTRTGYTFGGWYDNANLTGTAVTFISTTATGNKTFWAKWTINSYAIGASANPTEGGTVSGAGSYNYGASCTLTATPATGYNFTKWTKNNTQVSTNTNYTFTVNAAGTYVAQFTKKTYTISASANPTAGGTVTGAGTYEHGSTCTLTASPSTGYSFVNWTSENSQVSTNANYQFTVTGARTLVANFAPNTYTVTLNTNNGTINSGNVTSYTYGEGATLPTDVTRTGYTFGGWYDNANLTGTAVTAISNTATGNKTFWAKWTINSYAIGASANPTEGGTVSGAGSYNYGASCTLTATPATGYTFTNWKKGTQVVSTDASYQFTVTEAASYTATFTLNSYAITASANPTAGGTVTGAGTYNHGSTASLTATANTGYTFVNWTENGQQVSTNPTYSFTVTGAKNLVANFSLNSYPIAASANPNNGGTVTGAGTYDHGETATLTAMAAEGYSFVNWTEGTQVVSNNATYGFTVTGARTLVANFSLNSYTLTINYKYDNGTQAAPTHTESVNYNAAYNVTSPVINGYTADQLVVSGTMGADDVTVNVIYSINSYTLTINYKYADGTTAAATHTESVDYNATYSVASPDITGYTADQPMVTGTMGTENVTVNVTYSINSYTLTINYLYADGTPAATTHTESVNYNATYSVASPDITGYTADQPMVTGTMGTENVTVNVTYSINSYTLTINYKYADGTTAAATHTENVNYNATYSVASPVITGYTADQPVVTGTMGTEDVTVDVTYSINSYTLTINYLYADGTTAATTHTENVNYNATYSVASPDITGYTADQPMVTGTMGTENVTVNVTYSINSYSITVSASEGGSATGDGTYNYGATATLMAAANEGYTFVNWTENGNVVSTNATYSFTVLSDRDLVANFQIESYTIVVSATEGGTVTGGGTYDYGTNVTLSATAMDGYIFVNWTDDGIEVSTEANYSFIVNSNRTLVAHFEEYHNANHWIPVSSGSSGVMTLLAKIQINGVDQNSDQLELGVFCGTECRGSKIAHLLDIPSENLHYYLVDPLVYGDSGETFSFKLYNHEIGEEMDLIAPDPIAYTENGYGELRDPYVLNFLSTVQITASVDPENAGTVTGTGNHTIGTSCTLSAIANEGFQFMNWTLNGAVVSTEASYTFMVSESSHYVAHFAFVHSQPMTNGWNWWSTYIEMEGVDGLGMLKNSLGASCVRIQARYGYLDNLGSSWYGSLTSIENEQMYKIRTNAPCTAVIVGNAALPQNHPIIINEGWNWIGFPCSEITSIGTALQSFGPEVNDLIKSREGYASYLGNNYWYGSINAFEPGKGYMYKSNSSSSKTLQFTAGRGEENIAMNDHTGSRLFEPVVESFASNMTVTAVVDVDGEELRSEEYEVSAFVGNECRGSVKLMYIEPLDRYIAFLLVFGEDGEEITFTLTDGRGVCISEDVMVYSNDGMVGTLTEPANLHFGLDGLWDNEQMQIHVYPNPSKNIFNIEGVNLRRIEVVDGFGQVILSSEIEGDHIQINLGDRAIGTYLLRVITDSGIVSKKLIKTL